MQNNQQLLEEPELNWQVVDQLTCMLNKCRNPFIEWFQTVYKRLREAAAADPIVDPVTTMDCGCLPARLVAGCNTRTENVLTTNKIGGVVVDTAY